MLTNVTFMVAYLLHKMKFKLKKTNFSFTIRHRIYT